MSTLKYEVLDGILTIEQKDALAQLIGNEVMYTALKKVFLFHIYNNGVITDESVNEPLRNFVFAHFEKIIRGGGTDEQLGRIIRGNCEGILALHLALIDLEGIVERSKVKVDDVIENPAR